MSNHEQLQHLAGKRTHVFGSDGEKIGTLGKIFLDEGTHQPSFISVHTGLFGSAEHIVPVEGAELLDDQVRVGYSKDVVKGSPNVDPVEPLEATAERELYAYYSQPQGTHEQPKHHGHPHRVGIQAAAAGLGTPLIAEELIRQEGGVPEESRTADIETDTYLRSPEHQDFTEPEGNPGMGSR